MNIFWMSEFERIDLSNKINYDNEKIIGIKELIWMYRL